MEQQTSIQQVSVLEHSHCFHDCHSFNHLKHPVGRLAPVPTAEEAKSKRVEVIFMERARS